MNCEPQKDTLELRIEIIESCRMLARIGFCIGTWGNVSVRVEDGLLLTPSRVDYDTMTPDDLVVVDWDGNKARGERIPTSEMHLHRLLLLRRQDFGAVVHTHSPYASGVAASGRTIPVTTEDMAQIIGGEVRCTDYTSGAKSVELAEAACRAIGDVAAAVLLSNHGPVACGRTLAEAVTASQALEKAARIFIYADSLGGCSKLSDEIVAEERHRYLYKYGKE